jgi:AAA15 family ATPase/GTPase
MFQQLVIKNFAAFADFTWPQHGQINVIVGRNDTGKSHLLKLLYALARRIYQTAENRHL